MAASAAAILEYRYNFTLCGIRGTDRLLFPSVRPPSGDCGSATGLCCDRRPLKSQVQPTSLYLAWRFARPTLYPSVSVRKMDEGLTELRRRTPDPIWRERGGERDTREQRVSREIDKKEVDGWMDGRTGPERRARRPHSEIHYFRATQVEVSCNIQAEREREEERGFSITPFFPSLHRPPRASISRAGGRRSSAGSLIQSRHVGAGCGPPQSLHLILQPSAIPSGGSPSCCRRWLLHRPAQRSHI